MSVDGLKPTTSVLDYLEPPAGLSEEWNHVYRALFGQVYVVSSFFSSDDTHLLPLESLAQWLGALRSTKATAKNVLPRLHGRAPKTWSVGQAIDKAIFPVWANLESAVLFLTTPLPAQRNGQRISPEEQAAPSRARLAELREFDWRPLLANLAATVTGEHEVHLGISSSNLPAGSQKSTVPPVPDDPPLSSLQYDILDALRNFKATDADKKGTASTIAKNVGGDATEQSCKAPLANLKRLCLVDSRTGRGGGTWLTWKGLDFINRIRPPKER